MEEQKINVQEKFSECGKEVLKHAQPWLFPFPFVGVRRLSVLAEGGSYPSRYLFRYHTVSRTSTGGDGCCFFLSHDAADSKHINEPNVWWTGAREHFVCTWVFLRLGSRRFFH